MRRLLSQGRARPASVMRVAHPLSSIGSAGRRLSSSQHSGPVYTMIQHRWVNSDSSSSDSTGNHPNSSDLGCSAQMKTSQNSSSDNNNVATANENTEYEEPPLPKFKKDKEGHYIVNFETLPQSRKDELLTALEQNCDLESQLKLDSELLLSSNNESGEQKKKKKNPSKKYAPLSISEEKEFVPRVQVMDDHNSDTNNIPKKVKIPKKYVETSKFRFYRAIAAYLSTILIMSLIYRNLRDNEEKHRSSQISVFSRKGKLQKTIPLELVTTADDSNGNSNGTQTQWTLRHSLYVLMNHFPERLLSRMVKSLSLIEIPEWMRPLLFRHMYGFFYDVKWDDFTPDMKQFRNLKEFFTRPLLNSREISIHSLISPVDATILEFGTVIPMEESTKNNDNENDNISDFRMDQIKGVSYRLSDFFGGRIPDAIQARKLEEHSTRLYYAVMYLSPADYHRFHSPCNFTVDSLTHFPGRLLSVQPSWLKVIPGLFALNERIVIEGRWHNGWFFGYSPVAAYNVGDISIQFDSTLQTNLASHDDRLWYYSYSSQMNDTNNEETEVVPALSDLRDWRKNREEHRKDSNDDDEEGMETMRGVDDDDHQDWGSDDGIKTTKIKKKEWMAANEDYSQTYLPYASVKHSRQNPLLRGFRTSYDPPFEIAKGEEVGYFSFGSTIVMVFESEGFQWCVEREQKVRMGEALGEIILNQGTSHDYDDHNNDNDVVDSD